MIYKNFPKNTLGLRLIMALSVMCVVATSTAEEKKEEPPIDWSKPVVSRGFGQPLDNNRLRPDQAQAFRAAQTAYFFGNHAEAFKHWLALAEQGVVEAQANLGWMYQSALGTKKDLAKAKQWYEKAAESGHAIAQNNLGVLYEKGMGVKQDLARAYRLYLDSAQQGYRFAQYNVAELILAGKGTERNLQQAISWLEKASKQGVQMATEELAKLSPKTTTGQEKTE